ncbi:hypothetical protein ACILG0_19135 [Pseudomonadota bacterium AL_CKDN230030165-1A_HGKHYDSX7]
MSLQRIASHLILSLSFLLLLAPALAPAQDSTASATPRATQKMMAFRAGTTGNEIGVFVLRERPREAEAVVMPMGVDHPLDHAALFADIETSARDTRYIIEHEGQAHTLLIITGNTAELRMPGDSKPITLPYDAALSERLARENP